MAISQPISARWTKPGHSGRHARSTPSMRAPMVPTGIGPAICSWISDHGREDPPSAIPADTGQRPPRGIDRKSVVEGKRVSVREELGGRRYNKKKKKRKN